MIESFRNDLFPGYKSSAGMPPELLAQFPIAEAAVEALGIVLWPMVEFEADDAIAAAAMRFADDPRVERILICTPDKDMAQLVRDARVVLWDRRRGLVYDDAGVRAKWGVAPDVDPRLPRRRRRCLGRLSRPPGLGREVRGGRPAALRTARGRASPTPRPGRCRGSAARGRSRWPPSLREHWAEAMLYRDLARLRTADDGVEIRQHDADELRWDGAPQAEWEALLRGMGPRHGCAAGPHRWRED